ncbi:MAG: hypothetical protein EOP59_00350 [Sphingomonadales bacterium]|nr:MAG: hypothetical protein EOP59_00350 [Sphingomonadales bacterium]
MDAPGFPPAALAAARDAAKAHMRVLGADEDTLIATYAASALALAEAFAGRALILREWNAMLSVSPRWQALAMTGVAAITSVSGLSADGDTFALASDAYAIDVDADHVGWVRTTAPGAAGRIAVTYQAGLAADWGTLPAPIAQGVVLLVAHLFEQRDRGGAPPAAVSALWRPWRRMRLAVAERAA